MKASLRLITLCVTLATLTTACGDDASEAQNNTPTPTNNSTDNNSTDNNSTDNNSTDNNSTDNNSTDNNSTDNNSTGGTIEPPEEPAVIELLAEIEEGTSWSDVPQEIKEGMESRADAYLERYRERWGREGITQIAQTVIDSPTPEIEANVDNFLTARYGVTLSQITQPTLVEILQKYYAATYASWRVMVYNYVLVNGLDAPQPLDWDGVSEFDDHRIPDAQVMGEQEAYASELASELAKLGVMDLTQVEANVVRDLNVHLEQLIRSTVTIQYGGDMQRTAYNGAYWSWDIMWTRDASGGGAYDTDEAMIEALNAYQAANLRGLKWHNVGSQLALVEDSLPVLLYSADIEGFIGDPAQSEGAQQWILLNEWFAERAAAHPDADKACTIYTASDREKIWRGFVADGLVDGPPTLAAYQMTFEQYKTSLTDMFRSEIKVLVSDLLGAGTETNLDEAQVTAIHEALDDVDEYASLLDAAYAAIDAQSGSSTASDRVRAQLGAFETVGGYEDAEEVSPEDEAKIQAMWTQVRDFIIARYGGRRLDMEQALPQSVTVSNSNGSYATTDGETVSVVIGVGLERTLVNHYSTMIHEAQHAINFNLDTSTVRGAFVEGAALYTEELVLPKFLNEIYADDPIKARLAVFNELNGKAWSLGVTDATLRTLLRESCDEGEPNTIELVTSLLSDVYHIAPDRLQYGAVRAHLGTQYLTYLYGNVAYSDLLQWMRSESGIDELDPYHLLSCKMMSFDRTPEAVSDLQECLGQ